MAMSNDVTITKAGRPYRVKATMAAMASSGRGQADVWRERCSTIRATDATFRRCPSNADGPKPKDTSVPCCRLKTSAGGMLRLDYLRQKEAGLASESAPPACSLVKSQPLRAANGFQRRSSAWAGPTSHTSAPNARLDEETARGGESGSGQ